MSLQAGYTLEKVSNSSQGQHTKTNNHSHSQAVLSESPRMRSVPGIFWRERVRDFGAVCSGRRDMQVIRRIDTGQAGGDGEAVQNRVTKNRGGDI